MSVIHWFRRDLRLNDNIALHRAIQSGKPVIPLFIIDRQLLKAERLGAARLKFLLDALHSLDEALQKLGTRLLIREGKPLEVLRNVIEETSAEVLYFNRDYSPYAKKRDEKIETNLGIRVHIFEDALLLPPEAVRKADGNPYLVYTPYWKQWKQIQKPAISQLDLGRGNFQAIETNGIPSMRDLGFAEIESLAPVSENYALALLNEFIAEDIFHYAERRNCLAISPYAKTRPTGTSYLSPYLRLGLISPRQAYWAARDVYAKSGAKEARESIESWVSELAWREFYAQILHHFPHVLEADFVSSYRNLEWRDSPDELAAWQSGTTGYPIIDAAMRQLNTIGWMPNRARMIVASFLTKDLLIHWRHGDVYFMQHLIDGDVASNNGGWQWAAGTGTDAQPYFRIFNPVSQSERFASPEYLRYWLPELAGVPDKNIHAPWEMQIPPRAYPLPIVDHAEARERSLNAFKKARGET